MIKPNWFWAILLLVCGLGTILIPLLLGLKEMLE